MLQIPTALKIVAIVVVASWACAGAIRLLYPGVWKWIVEKLAILWTPCNFCFHFLCPEAPVESNGLKHHYVLPMRLPSEDRDSFSKSFTEAKEKRRKSEGSLRFDRRPTEINVTIPNTLSTNSQTVDIESPASPQNDTRPRSQSKTKKEGRRRGPGWVRGGPGRGIKGRGRFARESGFDYPFGHPNYDFPPDTAPPPDRVRGASEFDILNPLPPLVDNSDLFIERKSEQSQRGSNFRRSYSTNTPLYSNGTAGQQTQTGRKSDILPTKSVDALLLDI
jgi:hypothetical protein